MVAFAGPALADFGYSWVKKLDPATIIVRSDGESYTSLAEAPLAITGEIELNFDAETLGRVKFWAVWPELKAEDAAEQIHNREPLIPWIEYRGYGYSESYPVGDRPKSVDHTKVLRLPRNAYDTFAVSACNALAHRLRDEAGMGDQEIFSRNRTVRVRAGTGHTWEMTGAAGSQDPVPVIGGAASDPERDKVRIICQKKPSRVPPVVEEPTPEVPEVKKAEILSVDDKGGYVGSCGMEIDARITTNRTNEELKFRYVSDKGHESDIKTVNTGGGTTAILQHDYDLPSDSDYTGKIRIEGVSSNFVSAWKNYDLDCGTPNDLLTLLPPKATHLEAHTTGDEIRYQGHVCPAKVKVFGVFKGRGTSSGNVWLAVNGKPEAQLPFDVEDGQTKIVEAEYDLSWEGVRGPFRQDINLALYLTGPSGAEVGRLLKTQSFSCRKPQISEAAQGGADGLASGAPAPKSVVLATFGLGQKRFPGYICPERVWIRSSVRSGNKALKGTVALFAGGSLRKELAVDQPANTNNVYDVNHDLSWSGATLPEQTMLITVKFANQHGHVVKTVEKTERFACRRIGTSEAVPGGKSAGEPKPTHSQQAGNPVAVGKATLLPAAGFAIQAPKGRVRQGKIKLSGGKPNAKYALHFYRKTESGFKLVRSAKLPRAMTGPNAGFDMKALTGGRNWRLEVCAAGQKGKKACRTSDFNLPLSKASAGAKKTPKQPTPAKVFILPGMGG
ncbi:hypothetical protein HBA54_13390 [Pelagibius litoralis]|uniref:Uncharacterized protein n=1 Tax=Pelagibius litoralis TaxID=374515 RepID=A0A967EY71_9PROT|nr:hypothetical protein [Pelagibius litoralis]NIA69589.1 hypothetical protein [Pelagibius litoralis]